VALETTNNDNDIHRSIIQTIQGPSHCNNATCSTAFNMHQKLTLPPRFIQFDHFIHEAHICKSPPLRLPNNVWIAALFRPE
jgi:hypothetical protein